MRSDPLLRLFLVAAVALASAACADFARGPKTPVPDAGASADDDAGSAPGDAGSLPSYAADVHPLLVSGCQSCHSSSGTASDTTFILSGDASADYAVAISFINESSPDQSRLLRKGSGGAHIGGAVYPAGSDGYDTILNWIENGALP